MAEQFAVIVTLYSDEPHQYYAEYTFLYVNIINVFDKNYVRHSGKKPSTWDKQPSNSRPTTKSLRKQWENKLDPKWEQRVGGDKKYNNDNDVCLWCYDVESLHWRDHPTIGLQESMNNWSIYREWIFFTLRNENRFGLRSAMRKCDK